MVRSSYSSDCHQWLEGGNTSCYYEGVDAIPFYMCRLSDSQSIWGA